MTRTSGYRFASYQNSSHLDRESIYMAADFIDRSLAVGAEYEILQFLVAEHTLLTIVRLRGLTSWLLGVIKEVELALRKTSCS